MTFPIDIRPSDLTIVQEILRKSFSPDAKVWVFGSRANGKTKSTSDLDLAIDAGRKLTKDEEISLIEAFDESDLPYKVDFVDMHYISDNFKETIDDSFVTDAGAVKKVLFCTGKIYFELAEKQAKENRQDIAVVRVEQLYPLPQKQLDALYKKYSITYSKTPLLCLASIADFSNLNNPFSTLVFESSKSYQFPSFVLYNLQEF